MLSKVERGLPSDKSKPSEAVTDVALGCSKVCKRFQLVDAGDAWRIIFGVEKSQKQFEALRDVSILVPKGKIVGVLGHNGAGKSTLLRILGGVYKPTSGAVHVTGEIAGLFELGGLGSRFLTGREYAIRVLEYLGVGRTSLPDLLDDIREFSELGEHFERRIFTYSSGMAARLYFATATALERDIYLIDELLSVGDEYFQSKCWGRIRERLTWGASGVLVTHDWSAVIKLCERSYVLDQGEVAISGPSDEVIAQYLCLEPPPLNIARFGQMETSFVAETGQDLELLIPIEVLEPACIEFAFSIEFLRLGFGWEIVILSDYHSVVGLPGRRMITVRIPRLPLAPNRYSFNLFLQKRNDDGTGGLVCDRRTWTSGNGLALDVRGSECNALVRLPMNPRVVEAKYASY